jgi:predicted flavoprotein YhiN
MDNITDNIEIETEIKPKFNKKEYQRIYRLNNKEKLLAHLREYIPCKVCNMTTERSHMSRHCKTKKHQNNLKKSINELNINENSKTIYKRAYSIIQKQHEELSVLNKTHAKELQDLENEFMIFIQ